MRTSFRPTTPLGQIIWDFRSRHRLNREDAAKALGVGLSTVQSFESGFDLKTKLPINPREATLRLIADKMAEYDESRGIPRSVAYEDLMVAAGKLPQEAVDFHQDKTPEPTDQDLDRGELGIPGLDDLAADADSSWNELTPDEKRQVRKALKEAAKAVISAMLSGKRQRKLD